MNLHELKKIAGSIPDLGRGGASVKNELTLAAFAVKNNRIIIDIAPYMGSTTAYIGLGAYMSGNNVKIYSYDLWIADKHYVKKQKNTTIWLLGQFIAVISSKAFHCSIEAQTSAMA